MTAYYFVFSLTSAGYSAFEENRPDKKSDYIMSKTVLQVLLFLSIVPLYIVYSISIDEQEIDEARKTVHIAAPTIGVEDCRRTVVQI